MNFSELKQRHRESRQNAPENLNLRVHRALSWLQRAEMADDMDGRFIFLWIAFNAAYAYEIDEHWRLSEQETFKNFLEKICSFDKEKKLQNLLWKQYSDQIRILLDTPYVLQSFWDFHSGKIPESEWKKRITAGKKSAMQAMASGNTPQLLGVIFNRLYTLRNQLVHGGATWNSSVNRKQLKECTQLLNQLVCIFIKLMMDNPDTLWGSAYYPVVENPY